MLISPLFKIHPFAKNTLYIVFSLEPSMQFLNSFGFRVFFLREILSKCQLPSSKSVCMEGFQRCRMIIITVCRTAQSSTGRLKKSCIHKTLNLSTCANKSTNTKKFPSPPLKKYIYICLVSHVICNMSPVTCHQRQ